MKLRKHQKKQNKLALKSFKKNDHVLFAAPTGFGKSLCILDLVQRFVNDGERVVVIAPYRKLVTQILDTFVDELPALLMGSDSYGNVRTANIIVASLNTLSRRLKNDSGYLGDIDRVVIDEVHLGFNIPNNKPSTIVKPLYDRYWTKAKWLGFTATPITAGGYRLEGWDDTIFKYNTAWLIKKGWLSEFEYLAKKAIDTRHLKLQATGDYKVEDMEEITNTATAISAVHDNYMEYCKGKKTLMFAVSINHGQLIQDAFIREGLSSRLIHSQLSEKEQKQILEEYKNNVFDILINIAMLTTGFDDPEVEALIIARPIGSLRLAIQCWGRALRVHSAIDKVLILDLTGVYDKVGHLPDDNFNFDKVKKRRGDATNDDNSNTDISEVLWDCPVCAEVCRMIDCKREVVVTDELSITTYYCPNCSDVIRETSLELGTADVEKIRTAADIDYSKSYTHKEVMNVLGELIKQNTRNAKTSWGVFINKQCMIKDKKRYKEVFYGYEQGIYGSSKAWKRIMDIYSL